MKLNLSQLEQYLSKTVLMCLYGLKTSILNKKYLFYYLYYSNLDSVISYYAQHQIIKKDIERYNVRISDMKSQNNLVAKMNKFWNNINDINSKISSYHNILKSLINQVF